MKKLSLRIFVLLLSLVTVLQFCACGASEQNPPPDTTATPDTTAAPEIPDEPTSVLDGKKVIFIGNSFVYHGQTVFDRGWSDYFQEERENDQGYFYQLCRENGAEVDYIHGADVVRKLAAEGAVGMLLQVLNKKELFPQVRAYGALPRKAFSMGHANDKRYYLEWNSKRIDLCKVNALNERNIEDIAAWTLRDLKARQELEKQNDILFNARR